MENIHKTNPNIHPNPADPRVRQSSDPLRPTDPLRQTAESLARRLAKLVKEYKMPPEQHGKGFPNMLPRCGKAFANLQHMHAKRSMI